MKNKKVIVLTVLFLTCLISIGAYHLFAKPKHKISAKLQFGIVKKTDNTNGVLEMHLDRYNKFIFVEKVPNFSELSFRYFTIEKASKWESSKYGDDLRVLKLTFTDEGKENFANLTEKNINNRLAIIVNGKFVIAPVVRERISSGIITVSLRNNKETFALAETLKKQDH